MRIAVGGIVAAVVWVAAACDEREAREDRRGEMATSSASEKSEDAAERARDGGMMRRRMPGWMMSRGMPMDGEMMRDMRVIRGLLQSHDRIRREVELRPDGVRTVTTSDDPELASLIRRHVRQMKARVEEGRPIRQMDPVFREIFRHHEAIEMVIEDVPGGVVVVETSDDPEVVKLIQQHALRAVSEFVEDGMQRAMRPTPLPEGYSPRPTEKATEAR